MTTILLSKEDLDIFKKEIILEMKNLLNARNSLPEVLKSNQVKKILQCSDGKLDALRRSGTLPYTNLDGTYYYKYSDVKQLFEVGCKTN